MLCLFLHVELFKNIELTPNNLHLMKLATIARKA